MKLTLGYTSYGSQVCLFCGKYIDPDAHYGPPWDSLPPGDLVALFAQQDERSAQLVGYLCPECAAFAPLDVRRRLLQGAERLRSLATRSETAESEGAPENKELAEELVSRVTTEVIERLDQEQFGLWMTDAFITPLIGAGRMYGLCREAGIEDPLEVVSLGLISYKDMQTEQALRLVEDQEAEIIELADAMDATASQEGLFERVIQIFQRWAERRREEGSA